MTEVVLIDAGTGNLRSVQKALEWAGARVLRTQDPQAVVRAERVVLPGVGAFGEFMAGLRARGLEAAIREAAGHGTPLLGICVGMQALFDRGEEMGSHAGLGLLPGTVQRFAETLPVKIPHTGWNRLQVCEGVPLFRGIAPGSYVYFNHSYYCAPGQASHVTATTEHGITMTCAIQSQSLFGVQFHPEKSQAVGLQVLKNFVELP